MKTIPIEDQAVAVEQQMRAGRTPDTDAEHVDFDRFVPGQEIPIELVLSRHEGD